jgi:hypothetical protein
MRFLFWEKFQIVNAILRTLLNSQACQKFKLIENGEFDHLIKILKGVSSNFPLTSKVQHVKYLTKMGGKLRS